MFLCPKTTTKLAIRPSVIKDTARNPLPSRVSNKQKEPDKRLSSAVVKLPVTPAKISNHFHTAKPAPYKSPIRPRCPSSVFTLHPSRLHISALLKPSASIHRIAPSFPVSL